MAMQKYGPDVYDNEVEMDIWRRLVISSIHTRINVDSEAVDGMASAMMFYSRMLDKDPNNEHTIAFRSMIERIVNMLNISIDSMLAKRAEEVSNSN